MLIFGDQHLVTHEPENQDLTNTWSRTFKFLHRDQRLVAVLVTLPGSVTRVAHMRVLLEQDLRLRE